MNRRAALAQRLDRVGITRDIRRIVYALSCRGGPVRGRSVVHPGSARLWALNGAAIILRDDVAWRGWSGRLRASARAEHGSCGRSRERFHRAPRRTAVVETFATNGTMEGLALGTSRGMISCACYAPPIVQEAVHGSLFGIPTALMLWVVIIAIVSFVL